MNEYVKSEKIYDFNVFIHEYTFQKFNFMEGFNMKTYEEMKVMERKVNLFNALNTIRELAEENSTILSKLDELESEVKAIQKEKAISEAVTEMEWLNQQETAKNDIIKYIVEHGSEKIIIPIKTWNNWEAILSGFLKIEKRFYKKEVQCVKLSYYAALQEIILYY